MKTELSIRIVGEAGQGIQTISNALCGIFRRAGLNFFTHQDNMSRIRGGNNFSQIRLASHPVYAPSRLCDIILALDRTVHSLHHEALAANGIIVVDKEAFHLSDESAFLLDIPMLRMSQEAGQSGLFMNAVACGVIAALTGIPVDPVEKELLSVFSKKGREIVETNVTAARAGYDLTLSRHTGDRFHLPTASPRREMVLSGNEAIALGAIQAGCKFYSAYPMSPSTTIMETVCRFSSQYGMVVEQAEDEIAAINMIIGASFAGVRAMTATSGGGFALMTEGVSLAGMTETPIVVVDAQRPGPATGFPTRTEQGDLAFVIHGGHGEFAKVVYAPGTIEEAFSITFQAFETAEKYQIPVLILTDQHLAESIRNIDRNRFNGFKPVRYILSKEDSLHLEDYQRYVQTPSGISPRALPSWIPGVLYADSDEHTEKGHITEEAAIRVQMVEKRFQKKMAGLITEIRQPTTFNLEGAKTVLIGFGSTYGVLKEATDRMAANHIGAIHLSQVWPFPVAEMVHLTKNVTRILTVENNAEGQLAKLLRRETGINSSGSILKYDGRPFTVEELISKVESKG